MAQPINIIVTSTDKTAAGFKSVMGGMKGIGESARGTLTKGLKIAAGAFAGLGVAGAAGIAGMGAAITKMTLDAAQVEGVKSTFESLARSINAEAEPAMQAMREATRGMVADADLMQAGNKFMAMGLAESQEEMAKLSEIATQLGSAMGEGPTESMENFALMLANQSIPRLDSFGISSGKVRERIEELQAANAGMTRETAFMQAVMEQAEVTMAKVGEQGETSAASIARIQSTMENTALGIGQKFIPVLQKVLVPVADLATKIGPKLVEWAGVVADWLGDRLPIAITWLQDSFSRLAGNVMPVVRTLMTFIKYIVATITQGNKLNDWLDRLPEPLQGIAKTIGQIILAFDNFWTVLRDYGPLSAIAEVLDSFIPEEVMNKVWDITEAIEDFISMVAGKVSDLITWKDVLIALGIGIASIVLPAIAGLITSLIAVAAPILLVIGAVALLRKAWESDFLGIQEIVSKVADVIGKVVGTVVELFGEIVAAYQESGVAGVFDLLVRKVREAWPEIQSTLAEWGTKFWSWLTETVIPEVGQKIGTFVSSVATTISGTWPTVSTALLEWAGKFWNWLTETAIPAAAEKIGAVASTIVTELVAAWPTIWETLKTWGKDFWNWLTEVALPVAGEKVTELATTIADEVEKAWPSIKTALETWGESLWLWLTQTAIPQTSEKMNELSASIIAWAESPEGEAAGEAIGEAIVNGAVAAIGTLIGGGFLATKIGVSMRQIPGQLAETTARMGTNIVMGIVKAIAEKLGIELPKPVAEGLSTGLENAFGLMNPVAFLHKMIRDSIKALKTLVKAFKKPFDDLWKTIIKPVLDKIVKIWHQLFGNSELLDIIKQWASNTLSVIERWAKEALSKFITFFVDLVRETVQGMAKFVSELARGLASALAEFVSWAKETLAEIIAFFVDLVRETVQGIAKFVSEIAKGLASALAEFVDWASETLGEIISFFVDLVREAVQGLARFVSEITSGLASALAEFTSWISETLSSIASFFSDLAQDAVEGMADFVSKIISGLGDALQEFIDWGSDILDSVGESLRNIISAVETWASELYQTFKTALEALARVPAEIAELLRGIGQEIIERVIAGIQAVTDFVSRVKDQLTVWMGQLLESIRSSFTTAIEIGNLIVERILDGIKSVTTFASDLKDKLSTWLGQLVDTVTGWMTSAASVGRKIAEAIIDGFEAAKTWFINKIKSLLPDWIEDAINQAFSPAPGSEHIADAILEGTMRGLRRNRPALSTALRDYVASAATGIELPVAMTGAAPGLAMAGGGMAGGTTINYGGQTFSPTINNQMDEEEFYYRVQEALRQMES